MTGVRVIAACLTLAVMLAGPVQPIALAQQTVPPPPPTEAPPPPPSTVPAPAPVAAPPPLADQSGHRTDLYDVAAPAVTLIKAPFNAATCALGTAFGTMLFAITFGSAYKSSARVIESGCRGPWLITGDDLRPEPPRSEVPIGSNP